MWNIVPLEYVLQKHRNMLFEVVYDVKGERTRILCFDSWYARDKDR